MKPVSLIALVFLSFISMAGHFPADTLASFPGGDVAFEAFIAKNLRTTKSAIDSKITGDVIIRFTIDANGRAGDFIVKQSLAYGCNEEAIRVLQIMPPWQPQVINDKRVKSTFTQKFNFTTNLAVSDKIAPSQSMPNVTAGFGNSADDLAKYLANNFHFPPASKNSEGFVVLKFVVSAKGKTEHVKLVSGVETSVDNEVIRLVSGITDWNPKRVDFAPHDEYRQLVVSVKKKKLLLEEFK